MRCRCHSGSGGDRGRSSGEDPRKAVGAIEASGGEDHLRGGRNHPALLYIISGSARC